MPVDFEGERFANPILTVPETALLVGMPVVTLQNWAGQRSSRPQMITRVPPLRRGWPSIPLVGLVEASVLRGLWKLGLPRHEIETVIAHLRDRENSPHPLATQRLVTDGHLAYVLEEMGNETAAFHIATQQHVILEAVQGHLQRIEFADDGYPMAYHLENLPGVAIDPRFSGGRMAFTRTRTPLFAVAGSLLAGEERADVQEMYGLTAAEVGVVERNLEWLEEAA